jgi:hypothetical protein
MIIAAVAYGIVVAVMSLVCFLAYGVGKLPDFSTLWVNQLARSLNENTESLFPEQVSFRMQFPRRCRILSYRDHRVRNHYAPTGSCQLFSLKTIGRNSIQ